MVSASAIEPELAGHSETRGPGLQLVGVPRLDVLQRNGMEREQEPIPDSSEKPALRMEAATART